MQQSEVIELCPHCEEEVSFYDWSPAQGYIKVCPNCGKQIFLCSECMNADDFTSCDWCANGECGGSCFRAVNVTIIKGDRK